MRCSRRPRAISSRSCSPRFWGPADSSLLQRESTRGSRYWGSLLSHLCGNKFRCQERAGRVQRRAGTLASTVNLTYLVGAAFLVGAGAATWVGIYSLAVAAFLGFHLLQNVRRPMIIGCLSDIISHRTMATGLSVEARLRTLLMAGLAPLIGLLADLLGIGVALITFALAAAAIFPLLQVRDEKPTPEEILRKAGGDR